MKDHGLSQGGYPSWRHLRCDVGVAAPPRV